MDLDVDFNLDVHLDVHLDIEIIEKCRTIGKLEDLDMHLDVINIIKHMQKWTWMCTRTWGTT